MSDDGKAARMAMTEPVALDAVWPVYAGKSFNLWQPDTGDYYDSAKPATVIKHLRGKHKGQSDVPCLAARIAFRWTTNATDTRTMVIALIPPERVLTNGAPYLRRDAGSPSDEAFVLGVLSSMIYDWQVRRTIELSMTFTQLRQTSVPDPGEGHPLRDRVTEIAGRLAACDERFAGWAAEVGVEVGSVSDEEREPLLEELDACVALLYGLDADDVTVIYDTFGRPGQWDSRREAVLMQMAAITHNAAAA